MTSQVPRDALIRDLSAVLAGVLRPSVTVGPGTLLVARRVQDVLEIPAGATAKDVERRVREVLADGEPPAAAGRPVLNRAARGLLGVKNEGGSR